MTLSPALRAQAEALGQSLPPLLAAAEHLAATVTLGEHGRRRPGRGDDFWQYRPARPGDAVRLMDWRRSARSDQAFVQEREWQAAQSVVLWVDPAQSMDFAAGTRPPKSDRARLLALALAVLLLRAAAADDDRHPAGDLAQGEPLVVLAAAKLGTTRLIDNLEI